MAQRSRRDEHTEATRNAMIRAARRLFATKGYADTSTEDVVRAARVTRGSLYYHFKDKQDLFGVVHEQLQAEMAEDVAEASLRETDPWKQLEAGCREFLKACAQPEIRRICLLDAPSVIGWEEWRAVDAKHGFGLLQAGLAAAMQAGYLETQPLEPLSHVLLAALSEAGLVVAHARDVDAARQQMERTLLRILEGLGPRSGNDGGRPARRRQAARPGA